LEARLLPSRRLRAAVYGDGGGDVSIGNPELVVSERILPYPCRYRERQEIEPSVIEPLTGCSIRSSNEAADKTHPEASPRAMLRVDSS